MGRRAARACKIQGDGRVLVLVFIDLGRHKLGRGLRGMAGNRVQGLSGVVDVETLRSLGNARGIRIPIAAAAGRTPGNWPFFAAWQHDLGG